MYSDRKNIQPVPEIVTNKALTDLLFQITSGCGNNSSIDFDVAGAAQVLKLTNLNFLGQLGLQFQREFDLIQKQG